MEHNSNENYTTIMEAEEDENRIVSPSRCKNWGERSGAADLECHGIPSGLFYIRFSVAGVH
jgi:hypothetical protein